MFQPMIAHGKRAVSEDGCLGGFKKFCSIVLVLIVAGVLCSHAAMLYSIYIYMATHGPHSVLIEFVL